MFAETVTISSAEELTEFAERVNKGEGALDAVLNADIAFNGGSATADSTNATEWTPIGISSCSYKGIFDGNGHTISGIYINSSNGYKALFGYVKGGTIKNITLDNSYISGGKYVGGIVGESANSNIVNCVNRATVVATTYYAGGIVGYTYSTNNINSCSNEGSVTVSTTESYAHAGGIVGYGSTSTVIENCRNLGDVSANSNRIGGIIGYGGKSVSNCYSIGKVTGKGVVGSIVGSLVSSSSSTVTNCYYVGEKGCGNDYYNKAEAIAVTDEQVKSGELCYLLNGSVQGGTSWYQKIGTDSYPSTDSSRGKVYLNAVQICPDSLQNKDYNNISGVITVNSDVHSYINGFCEYCGGTQTMEKDSATEEYLISNSGQLYSFAKLVNNGEATAKARLTKDITVNESLTDSPMLWTPIKNYDGVFDGNGYTISGLYYSGDDGYMIGLFGSIGTSGMVKNLNMDNCFVSVGEDDSSGILCSYNYGSVENCTVSGTISGNCMIGGVAGVNMGSISGCSFNGTASGNLEIGGIAGVNYEVITKCSVFGSVTATKADSEGAGGIVGYNNGDVTSCYSIAEFNADVKHGGIVGTNGTSATVNGCYCIDSSSPSGGTAGTVRAKQKSRTAFNNGEVCYLINQALTENYWRQNIGEDEYPVSDTTHKIVYISGRQLCPNYVEDASYNNISEDVVIVGDKHSYNEYGFCIYCDEAEEAVLNSDGYYEIANYGQLVWFAEKTMSDDSLNALLVKDIVANEGTVNGNCDSTKMRAWIPICTNGYNGTFDGQGHTISGIYCNSDGWGVGLFAYNCGTIKNVNIVNSYFFGYGGVGAISGLNGGTITACSSDAEVVCSTLYGNDGGNVGGISGYNFEDCTIEYCYSKGSVYGNVCGGLVGTNQGKLSNSYTVAIVSGDSNVGIVCGKNAEDAEISNCYYCGDGSAVAEQNGTASITAVTATELADGSVCYELNASDVDNPMFYQTIGEDTTPTLDSTHGVVVKSNTGYVSKLIGDVDLSGTVDKTDVTVMLRYLSGLDSKTFEISLADVNGDETVDMLDAVMLLKRVG